MNGLAVVAVVLAAWGVVALWLDRRYPLTPHPRYKFRSIIPVILRTGAVTCLGFCFVRRSFITGEHRAHETYHHQRVRELGRWLHLWCYLAAFLAGLLRHGLARKDVGGRRYLRAYWYHPEEIAARVYAGAMGSTFGTLGSPTK